MTTIHFERKGGLLGNDIDLDLSLDKIPDDAAQNLQQLIQESDFFHLPEDLTGSGTPDEFQYVIRVNAGQSEHTVRVNNINIPESLSPLVSALSALQKEQRKDKQ
ncbi:MAG TPA: protealysin inhibitor emfourin [Anaerolineales bacterium]